MVCAFGVICLLCGVGVERVRHSNLDIMEENAGETKTKQSLLGGTQQCLLRGRWLRMARTHHKPAREKKVAALRRRRRTLLQDFQEFQEFLSTRQELLP